VKKAGAAKRIRFGFSPPNRKRKDAPMKNEEIATCPVAGWEIGPVQAMQSVMVRLDYLTHAMQSADAPNHTPTLVLTAQAALELGEALKKHAQLAMQGSQGAGLPKH
jgi:BssS protein family